MGFDLLWYCAAGGKEKDAKKLAKEFRKSAHLYIKDVVVRTVATGEGGSEIYGVSVDFIDGIINDKDHDDFVAALWSRLAVLGLIAGFIPVDDNGDPIYFLPSYYLQVIFFSRDAEKRNVLEEIVKKLCEEVPRNWSERSIDAVNLGEDGVYGYSVLVKFDDFLPERERINLRLAFYFRLIMLAKNAGFGVVYMEDSNSK